MRSQPSTHPDGRGQTLTLHAGEQVLAVTGGSGTVLDSLPDEAFENLLVVSTSAHPTRLEQRVRTLGHDPERVGVVPVTGSSIEYDGPMWVAERASPADLTGISIRVSEAMRHVKPGRGWLCFDSVGTLYMYADPERVYRLVDSLVDAARTKDAHGVYCVARGTLSESEAESLRSLLDGEVQLE